MREIPSTDTLSFNRSIIGICPAELAETLALSTTSTAIVPGGNGIDWASAIENIPQPKNRISKVFNFWPIYKYVSRLEMPPFQKCFHEYRYQWGRIDHRNNFSRLELRPALGFLRNKWPHKRLYKVYKLLLIHECRF